jgi:pilus assembly protein CpaF
MRLQTLGSMSEVLIPFEALKDQINSAVDVVVQLTRFADGSRKVTEVALVVSHGREQFRIATVSRFVPQPLGADRVVKGHFEHLPLPRPVAEKLYVANEPLPPAFGVAEALDVLTTRQAIG